MHDIDIVTMFLICLKAFVMLVVIYSPRAVIEVLGDIKILTGY